MIVWVSGATGTGKTSLARALGRAGYSIVEEQIPSSLFRSFAEDPSTVCASLQEAIMSSRYEGWQRRTSDRVAFDRSVAEDIEVFCELHFRSGLLSDRELEHLRAKAASINALLPPPDLVVYMKCSRTTLESRITNAPPPITDTLDRQLVLYRQWRSRVQSEVLEIDTTSTSARTLQQLFEAGVTC